MHDGDGIRVGKTTESECFASVCCDHLLPSFELLQPPDATTAAAWFFVVLSWIFGVNAVDLTKSRGDKEDGRG